MPRRQAWRVVCTRCHEEGDARWTVAEGRFLNDLLLGVLSLPVLCVPLMVVVAYRDTLAHWSCDVCGSKEIVPVGSKRALEIRGAKRRDA